MKPSFGWLTNELWEGLPVREKMLISAAGDADILKVKEVGRNNYGPRVREYLRSVGLNEGYAWCAAFVTFHYLNAGGKKSALPNNPASACNWLHKSPASTWEACAPERGCVGGWCDSKKWQGHLFFVVNVYKKLGVTFIETIEGNTGPDGGRDGDGVYRKTRRVTSKMRFVRLK